MGRASIQTPVTAPRTFLFDLDGTLAQTLADIAASTNHVRQVHELPPASLAEVGNFVGDGARTLLARALAERLPPGAERERRLDAAFASYVEHHQQQCLREVTLYPGVREFLLTQHAAGAAMAVVTNKPERFAVPIVAHLGLAELLPVVVGGDTLPVRKPDPAPLRLALERLGRPPQGAVMVGDGVQDLRAGKALGVRTIACLFGFTAPERLAAEGADESWHRFGG
jgi:phosphoglycolate phosphatase